MLVFGDPALVECQRRRWPAAFSHLFNATNLADLRHDRIDIHVFSSMAPIASRRHYVYHVQHDGGFGERLERAVEILTNHGYQQIVIIGSDCPILTLDDIRRTFDSLDSKRIVLGPDHRGGCYLIGVQVQYRRLISGVRWHKNTDFQEICERLNASQIALLPTKQDLDTLADLMLLASSSETWGVLVTALLALRCAVGVKSDGATQRFDDKVPRIVWQLPPPTFTTPFANN